MGERIFFMCMFVCFTLFSGRITPKLSCPTIFVSTKTNLGFLGGANGKESVCQRRRHQRHMFDPWVGKILGEGHGNSLD